MSITLLDLLPLGLLFISSVNLKTYRLKYNLAKELADGISRTKHGMESDRIKTEYLDYFAINSSKEDWEFMVALQGLHQAREIIVIMILTLHYQQISACFFLQLHFACVLLQHFYVFHLFHSFYDHPRGQLFLRQVLPI